MTTKKDETVRVLVTCDGLRVFQLLASHLELIKQVHPGLIHVDLAGEPVPPKDRSKVHYVALTTPDKASDVLKGLGQHTFEGVLFRRIVDGTYSNPQEIITANSLMKQGYKRKAIESSLHRLKTMGFIESRPITE